MIAARALAAVAVLVALAACSGSDDPAPTPAPESSSSAPDEPDTASLDVTITDPGGAADPARVAELTDTVSAALADGIGPLESCPLGGPQTFDDTRVDSSGTAGQVPTIVCVTIGAVKAEVSVLPGTTTEELVSQISAVTMRPAVSATQPLLGGEAFVACSKAESTDVVTQCGISWVLDDLFVHVEVSDLSTEPQQLADYLTSALPVWVAAK